MKALRSKHTPRPAAPSAAAGLPFRRLCLALFLCLLFCPVQGASEAPPKLIFKKQLPLNSDQGLFRYTVDKGEYVYSILRSFDVPEGRLPLMAQKLKRLNPHIKDLDRIEPGAQLNLPQSIRNDGSAPAGRKARSEPDRQADPPDPSDVEPLPYTVAKGDYLSKILREKLELPDRLIFDEYIDLFKKLNPDIENINALEVGQRVRLPAPSGHPSLAEARQAAAAGQQKRKPQKPEPQPPEPQNATQEKESEVEASPQPSENKATVLSMLSKLGFRFAPGKDMLYPFPDQGWLQINLEQMPLANAPWGDSILFVPENVSQRIEGRDFQSAGLTVCVVPTSWDLPQTFQSLEEASQRQIIAWDQGRSLILNQGHGVLEVQADILLIKDSGTGKRYYPFNLNPEPGRSPSQLLLAYLAKNNIRLYEQRPLSGKRPAFVRHDYPGMDSVFVPTIRRQRTWTDIKPHLGGNATLPESAATDFFGVFDAFKDRGLAAKETVRFHLYKQPGCRITLRMPVFTFTAGSKKTLIMSREQANPYLIALLSLRGHNCFALKREL